MRISELLRLVWMNLSHNKFKVILTAVGIIVGSATIMMVLAIGTGGKLEVAEQFKNLNAGAIDISYESNATEFGSSGGGFGGGLGGGGMPSGGSMPSGGGMPSFSGGGMPGGMSFCDDDRMNQENITLSTDDMEDLLVFVPGIADATISYTTTVDVEGGDLDSSSSYTIAGVKYNYAQMSNMTMLVGDFLTEENDENKEKYCVLGYTAAKEIFGSASEAYESVLYIDDRPYVVSGVLDEMGSVSSGISPDTAVFIPYETGIKYITGDNVSPTITVIAEDVNNVDNVITNIETVLADSYANAEFTISDAGTKMKAASKSNETLQMLLIAMAIIVFIVGGIGIMNVLFVSVKERTNEIGILKALGCSKRDILLEFLMEACFMSLGAFTSAFFSKCMKGVIEPDLLRFMIALLIGAVCAGIFGILI